MGKHHDYGNLHERFILERLVKGMPWFNLREEFKAEFGWEPATSVIKRLKYGKEPKPTKTDKEPKKPEKTEPETGLVPAPVESPQDAKLRKMEEMVSIKASLVANMVNYIADKTIGPEEKINRIERLWRPILSNIESYETSVKGVQAMTTINAQTVNVGMTLESMTRDEKLKLFKEFADDTIARKDRTGICPVCKRPI